MRAHEVVVARGAAGDDDLVFVVFRLFVSAPLVSPDRAAADRALEVVLCLVEDISEIE